MELEILQIPYMVSMHRNSFDYYDIDVRASVVLWIHNLYDRNIIYCRKQFLNNIQELE